MVENSLDDFRILKGNEQSKIQVVIGGWVSKPVISMQNVQEIFKVSVKNIAVNRVNEIKIHVFVEDTVKIELMRVEKDLYMKVRFIVVVLLILASIFIVDFHILVQKNSEVIKKEVVVVSNLLI